MRAAPLDVKKTAATLVGLFPSLGPEEQRLAEHLSRRSEEVAHTLRGWPGVFFNDKMGERRTKPSGTRWSRKRRRTSSTSSFMTFTRSPAGGLWYSTQAPVFFPLALVGQPGAASGDHRQRRWTKWVRVNARPA